MIYAIIDMNNMIQSSASLKSIAVGWINEGYTVSILEVTGFADTVEELGE